MKRTFLFIALTLASVMALAQNQPAGIRMEATEITVNDESYSLFTYTDEDGTYGYYLSLGHYDELLSISIGNTSSTLGNFDETCLYLGADREEAFEALDRLLALFDNEPGTTVELPARVATGGERLGGSVNISCLVHKKLLGGKQLLFFFPSHDHSGMTYLGKGSVKQLRRGLSLDKKLRPNKK